MSKRRRVPESRRHLCRDGLGWARWAQNHFICYVEKTSGSRITAASMSRRPRVGALVPKSLQLLCRKDVGFQNHGGIYVETVSVGRVGPKTTSAAMSKRRRVPESRRHLCRNGLGWARWSPKPLQLLCRKG